MGCNYHVILLVLRTRVEPGQRAHPRKPGFGLKITPQKVVNFWANFKMQKTHFLTKREKMLCIISWSRTQLKHEKHEPRKKSKSRQFLMHKKYTRKRGYVLPPTRGN
jgi:hypothetical protein